MVQIGHKEPESLQYMKENVKKWNFWAEIVDRRDESGILIQ